MTLDHTEAGSTPPPTAARGPLAPPEQEVRLAVVMYGGISLCIYIHGIAQELLRLVRATSGADVSDDEVATIYQEMSRQVPDQDHPERVCPTRFVIDILSGTSAGGINAVFLAKALAIRSRNLESLRQTWLETADIDKILNRRGSPTRSLLNGDWMYQKLYKAFRDMNTGPRDDARGYTSVEQLDLFATTTDLNGVSVPIRLADMDVPEKVHKGHFNFRCDNIQLADRPNPDELDQALDDPRLRRGDFEKELDAMLAFACRCTSSFPIAFAPMKLADIAPVIGKGVYETSRQTYLRFFRWIPPIPPIQPQKPVTPEERELADGGYLDNKPFDYAVNALAFRASTLRHTRKLFFVDPFPEIAGADADQPHFDFIQNAVAGSVTLPHYQTIREEIDRVKMLNRTQERLLFLQDRATQERPDVVFEPTSVDRLAQRYGAIYRTYHVVRLFDCTDDLARTVCALYISAPSDDAFLAVRYLVRVWREAKYDPNGAGDKRFENEFFTDFDFSFRMRRAVHLLAWGQNPEHAKPDLCKLMVRHLTRLHRRREQLALPNDANPLWQAVGAPGRRLNWDYIKSILVPVTDDDRMKVARNVYADNQHLIEPVAELIKDCWTRVFDLNRKELEQLRHAPDIEAEYQAFDYRDMVSLAFLEGSDVSEHAQTEIYRISPADGIQPKGLRQNGPKTENPLERKLAGYAVQAFGAFLKLDWRQNDILWGRLDACERIVSAVLNRHKDQRVRDGFIERLRNAIILQENNLRSARFLEPAVQAVRDGRLQPYLQDQYVLPKWPKPTDSVRQVAQAANIFGRMIEEDVGQRNGLTGWLKRGGGFAAQLVALLTPRSFWNIMWNYWLALFGLTSFVLFLLASIIGQHQARTLGVYGMGATVLVWFLSGIIGNLLAGFRVPRFAIRAVKWVLAAAVVVLIVIGVLHFKEEALKAYHRILAIVGSPGPR